VSGKQLRATEAVYIVVGTMLLVGAVIGLAMLFGWFD